MTDDELFVRQIDLLRFEAGVRQDVIAILNDMVDEISARISRGNLTTFQADRLRRLLQGVMDSISDAYETIALESNAALTGLAKAEAAFTAKTFGVSLNAALPTNAVMEALVQETIIMGASSSDWWERQAGDAKFRFKAAIQQGIVQGKTIPQIVRDIRGDPGELGQLTLLRRNAEALVRASVMTVHNAARIETMKANGDVVKGLMQISTLDNRTTDICIAYDGQKWDLKGRPIEGSTLPFNGGPPRHWNCRSTLVPITKTYRELGVDMDEKPMPRASDSGPTTKTFAGWLKDKPAAYQDKLLGKGKADLWRRGKITLQQLLDQKGRPLTLKQLQARS